MAGHCGCWPVLRPLPKLTRAGFTPASAEIATTARPVLDELAAILSNCPAMQMEIGGHTDSQGSEGGNQSLSQARAEAVLMALQGRRVDVSGMTATGFGEAQPIADNGSEAGREANRRIEFVLKGAPGAAPAPEPAAETAAEPSNVAAAPEAPPQSPVAGPDFSGDTSPSVAPTEKTLAPKPRPEGLTAEENQ
jgi:OOP family OmpA-OmpF porin